MRYLTLAEALTIAEAVTGIDAATLAKASRIELLDSALHAPQAGFGDTEFYPEFADKAAVRWSVSPATIPYLTETSGWHGKH